MCAQECSFHSVLQVANDDVANSPFTVYSDESNHVNCS